MLDLAEGARESISLTNTLWANTYVATGAITGIILFTGKECRS
jgi:phospholipid-translocating ATPase